MLLWHLGILSLGFFVPIRRFGAVRVRAVGCGLWAVGCGLWAVGCGLWAVGCGIAGSGGQWATGGCRGRSWEGRQAQASPRGL
jgi:hypothetical protein